MSSTEWTIIFSAISVILAVIIATARTTRVINRANEESAARDKETREELLRAINRVREESVARDKETREKLSHDINRVREESAARDKETREKLLQAISSMREESIVRDKETRQTVSELREKLLQVINEVEVKSVARDNETREKFSQAISDLRVKLLQVIHEVRMESVARDNKASEEFLQAINAVKIQLTRDVEKLGRKLDVFAETISGFSARVGTVEIRVASVEEHLRMPSNGDARRQRQPSTGAAATPKIRSSRGQTSDGMPAIPPAQRKSPSSGATVQKGPAK